MFVPFETLSPTSRLWIFQSDRKFTEKESGIISDTISSFTNQWTSHGSPMKASFELRYDHFILLGADEQETGASGCSIDGAVRTIKRLGGDLNIDFFDRNKVAFMKGPGLIQLVSVKDLKQQFLEGFWTTDTLTFNNLIDKKSGLENWLAPAGTTWLNRYSSSQSVVS